ncbi:MAG: ferritin-like domain-containing protein [Pyrinomonadaceae bacterium]
MNNNKTILENLGSDIVGYMTGSKENLVKAAKLTGGVATTIISTGVLAGTAFGSDTKLPEKIMHVLNFALTLEYLEDEYYRTGINSSGLIPAETRDVFGQISKHETAHVNLLKSVLGDKAVKKPNFDFTAGGKFADVFRNYQTFLALSQAFEDTGVRAYKGQAGNLMSNAKILTTALQIHSVEARHAAEVRRLRGEKAWITGDSRGTLPEAAAPVYFAERKTSEAGVVIANLMSTNSLSSATISQAFDEPLSENQVLSIAGLFIK